jgi:hypothetical protein
VLRGSGSTAEGGCATYVSRAQGRWIGLIQEGVNPKGLGVNKRDSPLKSEASTVDKVQQVAVSLKGSSLRVEAACRPERKFGVG